MTAIEEAAARIKAVGASAARPARDPVNQAMINNWTEALGDTNPIYRDEVAARAAGHDGIVAPPAMIQVWTMGGLHAQRTGDDPLGQMMAVLDEAGYTSVVATNCEQAYHRYLRPGERVSVSAVLDGVRGPKHTALGEGWFVTTRNTWYVGDEPVAEMLFRVLKFKPGADRTKVLRPVVSQDTAFFWEGTAAGELRVQHCPACGRLRHPPGPMCPACGADKQDWVVAAGRGTVFSYVVHHDPPVPGKRLPFVVALVELDEGVRMLAELVDVDPADVRIGMPVEVALTRIDDELTLPYWRPVRPGISADQLRLVVDMRPESAVDHSDPLPELTIEVSPTFVVSTALATRDFQDVHHDRDAAIARGSKDIFLNILTDAGLVQRYVTDWAGPGARIESIALGLGVPAYAYDTLTFSGIASGDKVSVVARGALGDHITATVTVTR
ncbi:MAG TPA: OB-fold domain-containing protein [Jatrophihabitans sp.]|nr:OB-fold domain-containing protein [Jatrophihabitans sp.]